MELWYLYTADGKPTGQIHVRGNKIPRGLYHPGVHVWIKNNRGQYLISQRAASRPTFPLMWETVGGSILSGEDSLTGALREVKEEVGIDLDPKLGRILFSVVRDEVDGVLFQDMMDMWLFQYDGDVDLTRATTDEVAQSKWMTVEEIQNLSDEGKLAPSLGYFFTKVAKA